MDEKCQTISKMDMKIQQRDVTTGKVIFVNPLNRIHLSKRELEKLMNCEDMMAKDM